MNLLPTWVFLIRGLLLLCVVTCALRDSKNALQQSSRLPQGKGLQKDGFHYKFDLRFLFSNCICLVLLVVPIVVECKAHSLFISVDMPSSGSVPRFEAIGAFFLFLFFLCFTSVV